MVQLPRLGLIKLKETSKLQGKVLSATITKEADRWYVSLPVEREITKPNPIQGEAIGIDVGLTSFATLSKERFKLMRDTKPDILKKVHEMIQMKSPIERRVH